MLKIVRFLLNFNKWHVYCKSFLIQINTKIWQVCWTFHCCDLLPRPQQYDDNEHKYLLTFFMDLYGTELLQIVVWLRWANCCTFVTQYDPNSGWSAESLWWSLCGQLDMLLVDVVLLSGHSIDMFWNCLHDGYSFSWRWRSLILLAMTVTHSPGDDGHSFSWRWRSVILLAITPLILLAMIVTHSPGDDVTHSPGDDVTHSPGDDVPHSPGVAQVGIRVIVYHISAHGLSILYISI